MEEPLSIIAVVSDSGLIDGKWPDHPGDVVWQVLLILFLVFLNGFFVAAEFAIVKVRASQLDSLIKDGRERAVVAKHVTEHLDAYLSATQLGITLASLALGWFGEPYIAHLIHPFVFKLGGQDFPNAHGSWIGFVVAFTIITFLHIVVGELMPKSLAIRKAVGTTLIVALLLQIFHMVFRGPIFLLNGCANWLLKLVFHIDPVSESELLHSADELLLLVKETEKSEEVTSIEREILIKALELNDLHVRDILTPRSEVVTLDTKADFEDNLKAALESGHTRFPLVEGHLDHSVGLIHIKDVLGIINQPEPDLESIKRPMPTVPEMMALDDLLKFFQRKKVHLAVVVDEFGGTLGIVMLDNVLEELVGDIQDEFDRPEDEREFFRISDDEFIVHGTMPLFELGDVSELDLDSPDVSTIGGYVTHLIGRLPSQGETVTINDWEATVAQTDGKSIGRLRFRRLAGAGAEEG